MSHGCGQMSTGLVAPETLLTSGTRCASSVIHVCIALNGKLLSKAPFCALLLSLVQMACIV